MARMPLFIVNPKAGGGRAARTLAHLRIRLASDGVPHALEVTVARGHAQQLAAQARNRGHDRVIVVGGDGTFQEVVNGLVRSDLPAFEVGLIPAGRGNDVARGLGLPSDLPAALRLALGGATRRFDVARARAGDGRERLFAAAGGAGFDAQVACAMETRRRFWMRGEAGYVLATLDELRRFRNHALRITLRTEGGERVVAGKFLFVAFANGPTYGGGMRICPQARTDDGLLDACLVGDLSRLAALRELPGIYAARHVRNPRIEVAQARSIRIEGGPGVLVHLDGEPFGTAPIEVDLLAGALRVACIPAA